MNYTDYKMYKFCIVIKQNLNLKIYRIGLNKRNFELKWLN